MLGQVQAIVLIAPGTENLSRLNNLRSEAVAVVVIIRRAIAGLDEFWRDA